MNKHTKIALAVLAIFIVGMTLSVAFAEPASAAKYKGKKSIAVTIKVLRLNADTNQDMVAVIRVKKENILLTSGKDQNRAQYITVGIQLPKIPKPGKYATNSVIKNL